MDLAIFATSQRAGSTLVQRIFNARPKTLVWGEGGRVLSYLCHALGQAELYAADSKISCRRTWPTERRRRTPCSAPCPI